MLLISWISVKFLRDKFFSLIFPRFLLLNDFEKRLIQVEGLKIKWTGGSKEEGPVIMLQGTDSVTIARTLKSTMGIEDLKVQNNKILVTLNNVSV